MGGRLLAEYSLRMGHTRVGLLSGPRSLESARQRRDGFVNTHPKDNEIVWEVKVPFDGALPAEAIGARAGELMLERIAGEKAAAVPPTIIDVTLIERDAVKRLE